MKKWTKPEIFTLGIENTFTDDVMTLESKKHPCHKTGNGEHNDNGNHGAGVDQNGHILSIGCPDINHYDSKMPICCCYGVPVS